MFITPLLLTGTKWCVIILVAFFMVKALKAGWNFLVKCKPVFKAALMVFLYGTTNRSPEHIYKSMSNHLRICLAAICVLAASLLCFRLHVQTPMQENISAITSSGEVNIKAAEQLRCSLFDLYSGGFDLLITQGKEKQSAIDRYQQSLISVNEQLEEQSERDGHNGALDRQMLFQVKQCAERISQAETKGMPAGLTELSSAGSLLNKLDQSAIAIDKDNLSSIHHHYSGRSSADRRLVYDGFQATLFLLVALLLTQIYIARRGHVLINIPLAVASLLVIFLGNNIMGFHDVDQGYLRSQQEQCFNSSHALLKAQARAHEAEADLDLILLETIYSHSQKQVNEGMFSHDLRLIVDRDHELTGSKETNEISSKLASGIVPFNGFLSQALLQETDFAMPSSHGLRSCLCSTLAMDLIPLPQQTINQASLSTQIFSGFLKLNDDLEATLGCEGLGKHNEALGLHLTTIKDLNSFDNSINRALSLNQSQLDAANQKELADLQLLGDLSIGTGLAILALGYLGLMPWLVLFKD